MITFKGTPVTLEDKYINVGDSAPDFHLTKRYKWKKNICNSSIS